MQDKKDAKTKTTKLADKKITKHTTKEEILKLAGECKKCGHCCKFGSGFVLSGEIAALAKHLDTSVEEFKKEYLKETEVFNTKVYKFKVKKQKGKPYGACVFLDNRFGCVIHDVKPVHCKTGFCNENSEEIAKWFSLNHFVNTLDPESIRQYASYLKVQKPLSGGELHELVEGKDKLKRILEFEELR